MFETFCLRLGLGLIFALWLLPRQLVQPRFYRIHLSIVLGLAVAAGWAATANRGDAYWAALGLALAASLVGTRLWALEGAPGGQVCLLAAVLALGAALWCGSGAAPPAVLGQMGIMADHLTAAFLLGVVTTAMLMGHWYLITPTMALEPLLRLLKGQFVAIGVRMLASAGGLWASRDYPAIAADHVALLWLALRWGAGFVGPLALTWMAWQSARIRSTQSATGILYVVVIFTFIGELTEQLLQSHLDGPLKGTA